MNAMKWPARSTDLKPIENLWSILAEKVCTNGKHYYNVNEITTAILSEWTGIKSETLRILVNSMPKQ